MEMANWNLLQTNMIGLIQRQKKMMDQRAPV